ncbi:DNA-binding HxlR family transcriptional regulator [Streptomyces africanus]|uniref:DNA-binding HxlR family transcriptional regulator n=1 Tax=Streptomyces africanus TaxID=231024 RepID=A0ABU0QLK4_9ACTN|nr:DNA-binding HxlR family transcriptional regulator [Streptomyces africanus]
MEYESTELARTLIPVFNALAEWSEQHMTEVLAARAANQDV